MISKTIIRSTRVPFLLLTPICVFLGLSIMLHLQAEVDWLWFSLALTGALAAHISVNTFNEYYDFKSGLDLITKRTPFSGGSGALPENPEAAKYIFRLAVISILFTIAIGLYFISIHGMALLPIGLLGVITIVSYSGWINRQPIICLISPGIGFGLFMVTGTQFVLAGEYYLLAWIAALIPFFLVNNLLLLNQFPDIDADKQAGRRHFPIQYGPLNSSRIYLIFLLACFMALSLAIWRHYLPDLSWICLLTLPLGIYVWKGSVKFGGSIAKQPKYLAANVIVTLTTPLILGATLSLSNASLIWL